MRTQHHKKQESQQCRTPAVVKTLSQDQKQHGMAEQHKSLRAASATQHWGKLQTFKKLKLSHTQWTYMSGSSENVSE
jgi:hypothetical protein